MKHSDQLRKMNDGTDVFCQRWLPETNSIGTIVLVHGIAEHSGRYAEVADRFTKAGYTTSAFDLRGFGKTNGKRGHLRFDETLNDIDAILDDERQNAGERPIFLLGHSLGGLIVLYHALIRKPAVTGIVAMCPALHTIVREQKIKVVMARLLGKLAPKMTIPSDIDDTQLISDPEKLQQFRNDPLVHDQMSMGFGMDAMSAMDTVLSLATEFALPTLLVHAKNDQVNFLSGSEEIASKHAGDCTLKVYGDVRHDLKCEKRWPEISNDILAWMKRII